jgi:hypothetical protein
MNASKSLAWTQATLLALLLVALGGSAAEAQVVCGNEIRQGSEQCDLGFALNGAENSCCTASCTFAPTTTVCRGAADLCDVAEFCPGNSTTCPADGFADSTTV